MSEHVSNEAETAGGSVTVALPVDMSAAYDGLMRAKEAFRAEAHRLARELADAKEALKPFADLAEVCVHFKKTPGEQICSWRINGQRHEGPTVADCIEARRVLGAPLEPIPFPARSSGRES